MENSYFNAFLFEKGNFHVASYSKESDAKDGYIKDAIDAKVKGIVVASEIAFHGNEMDVKVHLKNKTKVKNNYGK